MVDDTYLSDLEHAQEVARVAREAGRRRRKRREQVFGAQSTLLRDFAAFILRLDAIGTGIPTRLHPEFTRLKSKAVRVLEGGE